MTDFVVSPNTTLVEITETITRVATYSLPNNEVERIKQECLDDDGKLDKDRLAERMLDEGAVLENVGNIRGRVIERVWMITDEHIVLYEDESA